MRKKNADRGRHTEETLTMRQLVRFGAWNGFGSLDPIAAEGFHTTKTTSGRLDYLKIFYRMMEYAFN
jgi:hypothetical protein